MPHVAKKTTKKFEKRHLKDVLEKRKEFKKIKQRYQIQDKKRARKAEDLRKAGDIEAEQSAEKAKSKGKGTGRAAGGVALEDLTVDDFFQGGVSLAEGEEGAAAPKKQKAGKHIVSKKKTAEDNEESDSGSDESFGGHKGDLEALAQKDPEFYQFLKENDAELLDFDEGADLGGIDDLSEEEPPKKKAKKKASNSRHAGEAEDDEEREQDEDLTIESENLVSMAMVQKWEKALIEKHSLRSTREVVLAFRAAVHSNDDDEKEYKYAIDSAEVYHKLVTTALKQIPSVLEHHIPVKENASGRVHVSTDSKKFRTMTPLLSSHALSVLHLLESLSDDTTMIMTLSSLLPLLPYLLSFKKVIKTLLKVVVGVWSEPSCTEATRINAFLIIRRLAVIGDPSIREAILKSTYHGLVKSSRNTTVHTLPGINLIKNSAIELWGIDMTLGYTTGFTYIRQLAIHLRSSINQPTKDSYKIIYNWQYTHSLDFWSRVLSTLCSPTSNPTLKKPEDSPLHPLIYPLIQVHLGALRLIPTPAYFPLRFHLTQSLLRLSRSTDTYIPLIPSLLEVLQFPDLKDSARPSTLKPLDFSTTLRAPKSYLRTRVYQDGVGEQVTDLLAECFGIWAKNIAFPELAIPPTVQLKRWLKDVSSVRKGLGNGKEKRGGTGANFTKGKGNRNSKLNSTVSLLLQKISANAAFVEEKRSKVEYSVSQRREVEAFLRDTAWEDMPLGAYIVGLRKQREARERVLEQGRREEETRRRKERERETDTDRDMEGAKEEDEDQDEDEDEEMLDDAGGFEDEDESMSDE